MQTVRVTKEDVEQVLCVRIFGGLGNQMFQYAAAYARARHLNVRLLLHVAGSARLAHASFGLADFPLDANIWDQAGAKAGAWLDRLAGRHKRKTKHGTYWPGPRFQHDSLTVSPDWHSVAAGSYLAGYFQSEDYFADHADSIRAQFSLAHLDGMIDEQSLALVKQPGSVSVHIRRGDYLDDPKVLKIHGILGKDHYQAAYELTQKLVPGAHFCIFSDDRDAADALTRNWPNRTVMPAADRLHDLRLMSLCSHQIVANSSFSWWGAWLNASPNKTVIAPRRWYSREHMQSTYIDDICPRGWILI